MLLDSWPTCCLQHENSNSTLRKVLLVAETLVCCYQKFEARRLRSIKQLTVAQRFPTPLVRRLNNMTMQHASERYGSALIEENPHPLPLSAGNLGETLLCVFQNGFNLLPLHTWEPLQEVLNARPSLKILKQ
jgi:hypothetical protein